MLNYYNTFLLQWRHRWGVMTKLSPAAGEYMELVILFIGIFLYYDFSNEKAVYNYIF